MLTNENFTFHVLLKDNLFISFVRLREVTKVPLSDGEVKIGIDLKEGNVYKFYQRAGRIR